MIIEKDKYLKQWVVWLRQGNLLKEVFSSKNKKDCEKYIEKESRKKYERRNKRIN